MNELLLKIEAAAKSAKQQGKIKTKNGRWTKVLIFLEAVYLIVRNLITEKRRQGQIRETGVAYQCVVLSLARKQNRREFMKQQLMKENINFEFVDAIDGQTLDIDTVLESLISAGIKKKLPKGAIACALSHYSIWVKFIENKTWEHLLVLEDDAVLIDQFKQRLNSVLKETPDNFHYLAVGSCGKVYRRKWVSKRVFMPYNTSCTHGYLISRSGAVRLLAEATPISVSRGAGIDLAISELIKRRRLVAYSFDPLLCSQTGLFESDIDE